MVWVMIIKHIAKIIIYIHFCILALTVCITGCGEDIYDLAKRANDGITIGAALAYDGGVPCVILTDGEDYYRQIDASIIVSISGTENLCIDSRGRIHIGKGTTIYTYSFEDKQWYTSTFDSVTSIASGNGEVYALVTVIGTNYIYRFSREDGNQWVDSGIVLLPTVSSPHSIARDPVTGNLFISNWVLSTATVYKLTELSPFGSAPVTNTQDNFAVYNNEAFFTDVEELYSSFWGQMTTTTGIGSKSFAVADQENIFLSAININIELYRFNNVNLWELIYTSPATAGIMHITSMGNGTLLVGISGATPSEYNGLYIFDCNTREIVRQISPLITHVVTTNR